MIRKFLIETVFPDHPNAFQKRLTFKVNVLFWPL